jgi:hypothetical protein
MVKPAADPLDLVSRFAAGDTSNEVLQHVRGGFSAWVRAGAAVPLERCLRLPNTPKRARRLQRDHWLCEAANALKDASAWATSVAVSRELGDFLTRGPWRVWQDLDTPPSEASTLRTALFHLAKANGGRSITPRHVNRLIGHIFEQQ